MLVSPSKTTIYLLISFFPRLAKDSPYAFLVAICEPNSYFNSLNYYILFSSFFSNSTGPVGFKVKSLVFINDFKYSITYSLLSPRTLPCHPNYPSTPAPKFFPFKVLANMHYG